jgi:hypothetical protein
VVVLVMLPMHMRVMVLVSIRLLGSILVPEHFTRQLLFAMHQNINFGCSDAAAVHAGDFQTGSDVQCSYDVLEEFCWHSGIDQSPKEHVTTYPGETIEVGNPHNAITGRQLLVVVVRR